jgi:elongation factor Ts
MANYTAADVKKLRELTGAGMMDCKNALAETDGDFDKAIEVLRIKGAAKAAKRGAERTAGNGLVAVSGGAMIELNCETDFVAKNEQFQRLADDIVGVVAATKTVEVPALLEASLSGGDTVSASIDSASAVIGEKLELRRAAVLGGDSREVAVYLHRKSPDLPPQVGVLVEFTGAKSEAARGVAMQIAAMRPQYLRVEDVPEESLAHERRIAEATAREEGKPEAALPKIIEGRVKGYLKEVVLLEQASVQDNKKTVKAVLEEAGVTVSNFARFEVGQP